MVEIPKTIQESGGEGNVQHAKRQWKHRLRFYGGIGDSSDPGTGQSVPVGYMCTQQGPSTCDEHRGHLVNID